MVNRQQSQGRVLVVEDNDLNLKLFIDLLSVNGFEVKYTKDGNKVLGLCEKFLPDLILMDIQLQGISGYEVIKLLKDDIRYKDIPIVAVTAFAMKDDKEKIMSAGCQAYIAKPISIGPFLETINDFLQKKAS